MFTSPKLTVPLRTRVPVCARLRAGRRERGETGTLSHACGFPAVTFLPRDRSYHYSTRRVSGFYLWGEGTRPFDVSNRSVKFLSLVGAEVERSSTGA